MNEEPKRWVDVYHYGFGYTRCPYCGDETGWYNPVSQRPQSDLKNNQREHCPKCGKRVYAREGWIMNQPPEFSLKAPFYSEVKKNNVEFVKDLS